VHPYSAGRCPNIDIPRKGVNEFNAPTRSAHQKGNRGGHILPEEAGSVIMGKFLKTPTPMSQPPHRNTPPTLSYHRGWAMGRGRGGTRVEETKNSTL